MIITQRAAEKEKSLTPTLNADAQGTSVGQEPLPQNGQRISKGRNPLWDWLRLTLALEVFYHHLFHVPEIYPAVAGFLGLSGYLVLHSYEQSRSWWHFAWKRILRIVPALTVMLLIVFVNGGWDAVKDVVLAYVTLGIRTSQINNAVWSLGWEELFYALLAILFAISAYRRRWPIWILGLISVFVPVLLIPNESAGTLIVARPLAAAFFAGNLCYLYRDKLRSYGWLGVVIMPVAIWLCTNVGPKYDQVWRPVGTLPLFSLACLLIGIGYAGKLKLPKIPDISYGLYIYHLPLIWLVPGRFGAWVIVPTILIAVASWYIVEKPALRLKDSRLIFRKKPGGHKIAYAPEDASKPKPTERRVRDVV